MQQARKCWSRSRHVSASIRPSGAHRPRLQCTASAINNSDNQNKIPPRADPLASYTPTDVESMEVFITKAGMVSAVVECEADVDVWGESTCGDLHLEVTNHLDELRSSGALGVFKLSTLNEIESVPLDQLKKSTANVLKDLNISPYPEPGAIGYDMDYTLINYDVNAWEGRAYAYGLESLREQGIPVEGLSFDPQLVIRGLIMDKEKGNLIKVDRFGLVKRAMHGTRMMSVAEIRQVYGREVVNLRNEGRWLFLNTLFSVSEACMMQQLVDRLDMSSSHYHIWPLSLGNITYQDLYKLVAKALFRTHVEGKLKSEIIQEPEKFVELDPSMAQTLMDQRDSGKQLLLITNSDFEYTNKMMSYSYDRYLPNGMKWRDLFDMIIVQARKPDFFNANQTLYEIVTEDGLMKPVLSARKGGLFCGGSARMVEKALGIEGDAILYVGDHIYTDAALAKLNFQWRTALILRELEDEIDAMVKGQSHRNHVKSLMIKKERVGDVFNHLRLARQRLLSGHRSADKSFEDEEGVEETLAQLLMIMEALDDKIGPGLEKDGEHFNHRWGFLSRAGLNDKSQLTRQIEKYADIYTSRVSNFLRYTPFAYFRSPSTSVAHDVV